MCVILFCDEKRPNESMVGRAYQKNDKGAGIAYRKEVDGKTLVFWKKGLNMDQIQEEVAKAPLPFVAHFRIPSFGGPHLSLNHPFPVDLKVGLKEGGNGRELAMEGLTDGPVLFHNGSWSEWRKFSLDTASKQPEKFPNGRWSDTRAMAWVAAIYGLGILELINEKVIAFGPENIDIYGDGWDEDDGIYVSNMAYKSQTWPPKDSKWSPSGNKDLPTPMIPHNPHRVPHQVMSDSKSLRLPEKSEKSGGTSHQGTFRTSRGVQIGGSTGPNNVSEQVEGCEEPVFKGSEEGDSGPIICVRENFGGKTSSESDSSLTLTREEELKKWALATQDNPAKGRSRVVNFPHSDTAERNRRLANARKGIVHGGLL